MTFNTPPQVLKNVKALMTGIANEHSIAHLAYELGPSRIRVRLSGETIYVDGGVNIMA